MTNCDSFLRPKWPTLTKIVFRVQVNSVFEPTCGNCMVSLKVCSLSLSSCTFLCANGHNCDTYGLHGSPRSLSISRPWHALNPCIWQVRQTGQNYNCPNWLLRWVSTHSDGGHLVLPSMGKMNAISGPWRAFLFRIAYFPQLSRITPEVYRAILFWVGNTRFQKILWVDALLKLLHSLEISLRLPKLTAWMVQMILNVKKELVIPYSS